MHANHIESKQITLFLLNFFLMSTSIGGIVFIYLQNPYFAINLKVLDTRFVRRYDVHLYQLIAQTQFGSV